MSDYVREVLRASWAEAPSASVDAKLQVVREAAAHAYPTGDPEQIEAEIRASALYGLPGVSGESPPRPA